MTIGIVCNALLLEAKTGVERYVQSLLRAMANEPLLPGERVLLYVAKKPVVDFTLPAGWEWEELPFALGRGWTHMRLSWEMFRRPPSVLFVPAHEVPLFVDKKTRVVATVHDVAFRHFPAAYERPLAQRQEWAIRHALRRAKHIITVSEATKRDLVALFHVTPERITTIPLAVDASAFVVGEAKKQEVLARYRLTAGKYLFYIGRLEEKKNIVTLVNAFAHCKEQLGVGHPLQLVLAGNYGYGRERIARAIAAAGADVRVLGFVPDADAAALMQGALALCFPSLYEGFGLPILEGFAAGVPVLASDIASSREVAGDAALFVAASDTPGWTRAMQQCVFDAVLREALAAKGTAQLQEFSWSKTAAATWQVLRAV